MARCRQNRVVDPTSFWNRWKALHTHKKNYGISGYRPSWPGGLTMRPIEFKIPDGRMAFGDVPEHIDARLQEAVKARLAGDLDNAERLLWEAHNLGPRVL